MTEDRFLDWRVLVARYRDLEVKAGLARKLIAPCWPAQENKVCVESKAFCKYYR